VAKGKPGYSMRRAHLMLLATLVASDLGCSTSGRGLVPVAGKVTLDGAPIPGVYLFFDQPQAERNVAYIGQTDEQGHFELRRAGEDAVGAAPGAYRVTLSTAVAKPGSPDGTPLPPERVPEKYAGGKLKFDVPASGSNEANFEMKSKG
jgi:hypothetical protein